MSSPLNIAFFTVPRQDVDALMMKHENELRVRIKQVLRDHAAGIDDRATPLEQLRKTGYGKSVGGLGSEEMHKPDSA